MGNRCEVGPNPGDTCEDVYGPTTVDSLSSAELGQFVEERFAPTSLDKLSRTVNAAGSIQSATNTVDIRCPVEADCPSETTHGAPDVGLQSGGLPAPISSSWPHHTTEDSAELYPQPNSVNTTPLLSSPLSLPPHDFHNDIDISPGSPSASSSSFQYCNPNTLVAKGPHGDQPNHALGHSTEVPGLQVDGNDPLCHLIDIEEFQGMSLLTRFQSYLKVFVCERCHYIGYS
ncbi:hypothetical protein M405DRAFT_859203 [Rhizopogon salebrosus TDB-379]|nr:hypothetical protein M405DRAFT_859203 [Rhizopogon salebrosus TDB-379]